MGARTNLRTARSKHHRLHQRAGIIVELLNQPPTQTDHRLAVLPFPISLYFQFPLTRVQCQACLSIAESRPRVDEVNFPLPSQAVQPYIQHRLPKPPARGLILHLTSHNIHPSCPSSYALSMFDFAKLSPCICQNILLQLTIRSIRNCHFYIFAQNRVYILLLHFITVA